MNRAKAMRGKRVLRKQRKPVGATHLNLEAPKRAGYMRRWVNDNKNRLQRFSEGDWEFVMLPESEADEASGTHKQTSDLRVRQAAGTQEAGGGALYTYLMEIPIEFYNEDQATKAEELDEIDKQLEARGGGLSEKAPGDVKAGVFRDRARGASGGIRVKVGR